MHYDSFFLSFQHFAILLSSIITSRLYSQHPVTICPFSVSPEYVGPVAWLGNTTGNLMDLAEWGFQVLQDQAFSSSPKI